MYQSHKTKRKIRLIPLLVERGFLAMQTRASPWRARAWGIHFGRWPSETGRQGKHADKGKLVEGEGMGGEPEHSFNALSGSNACGTLPGQICFDH